MRYIKSLLRRLGLYDQASRSWIWLRPRLGNISRLFTLKNRRVARRYLNQDGLKKLHIGCGPHGISGWLNGDLCPWGDQIRLDATKEFPFNDAVFDFIYSEHMIEHVPWSEGMKMLKECYRVLKPGGVIRIATPDLIFVTGLLKQNHSPLELAYMRHCRSNWISWAPDDSPSYVINNAMRAWGHQFLYDETTLGRTLALAGFGEISRHPLQESAHEALRNLAAVERSPDGLLALETLVIEGVKRQA